MNTEKCSCGSKKFEIVDATPIGDTQKRYFKRCKRCGLIVLVHRCGRIRKWWASFELNKIMRAVHGILG